MVIVPTAMRIQVLTAEFGTDPFTYCSHDEGGVACNCSLVGSRWSTSQNAGENAEFHIVFSSFDVCFPLNPIVLPKSF